MVAAAVAAMGLGQAALATTASATGAQPQSSTCPITWQYTKTFEYNPSTFVVRNPMYFGLQNTGRMPLAGVTLTATFRNINVGKPTVTGGRLSSNTDNGASATATAVAKGGKFAMSFPATLTKGAHQQDIEVQVKGPGLDCQPLKLTTRYDTTKPAPTQKPGPKPSHKPTAQPTHKPAPAPSDSKKAPAPVPSSNGGKGGKNLAETGADSNTPMLAGGAAALVVVGGGLAFFATRRRRGAQG